MAARDLLGKPVEPYTQDDPEANIPLKVPAFGAVLPVLQDYSAYTMQTLRQFKGVLQDKGADPSDSPISVYQVAVPLLKCCLVEELGEDEVFELMQALGIQLEYDLNHPLLTRCLELAGQKPREEVAVMSDEEAMDLLTGKQKGSVVDPTSG